MVTKAIGTLQFFAWAVICADHGEPGASVAAAAVISPGATMDSSKSLLAAGSLPSMATRAAAVINPPALAMSGAFRLANPEFALFVAPASTISPNPTSTR
jgi:hypothetical protein